MRTRRNVSTAFAAIMTIPLILAALLVSVHFFATFKPFYNFEYRRNDNAQVIGTDDATLSAITDEVIKYLEKGSGNMWMSAVINGEYRQVFNEKEISHMEDVLYLFRLLRYALFVSALVIVLLFIASAAIAPKEQKAFSISRGVLIVLLPFLALLIAVGVYVAIDFSRAFYQFHLIFFANDAEIKWILDPATDVLIQMVPEQFFVEIAFAIGASFLIMMMAILFVCLRNFIKGRGRVLEGMYHEDELPQSSRLDFGHKEQAPIDLPDFAAYPQSQEKPKQAQDVAQTKELRVMPIIPPEKMAAAKRPLADEHGVTQWQEKPVTHAPAAKKAPNTPKMPFEPEIPSFIEEGSRRPAADEIFRGLGIDDDSAVPPSVRQLLDNAPISAQNRAGEKQGVPTAREILDRLDRL